MWKNLEQILKPQNKFKLNVGNLNNLSSKHSKTNVFQRTVVNATNSKKLYEK